MTRSHIFTLLLAFIVIEALLVTLVDRPLSLALHDLDTHHPTLINFFRTFTDLGKSKWWLWPAATFVLLSALVLRLRVFRAPINLLISKMAEGFFFMFVVVAASGLITDAIKPLLGRSRPLELLRYGIYEFSPLTFNAVWNSMPSGHATTAFALVFATVRYFPKGQFLWWALGILLAFSRVMVNAHFFSDILAGLLVAWLTTRGTERLWSHPGIFHYRQRIFPIDTELPLR